MTTVLAAVGGVLLFLLKVLGILLLVVLALMVLLLLIPFCADVSWEQDTLTVKAGALGITFPVFQYPKPEPTEESKRKKKPKKAKAAKKPAKEKKPAEPRKKAKLTLNILCTILRGAGTLIRAVFGALCITHIRVCLGVRGEDPAAAARNYGKLQAWLYPVLGVLDHRAGLCQRRTHRRGPCVPAHFGKGAVYRRRSGACAGGVLARKGAGRFPVTVVH